MRIDRYVTLFFAGTVSLLCSCSDSSEQRLLREKCKTVFPDMVHPVLSGKSVYELGADITLRVTYPASDWELDGALQDAIEAGDRKPWHIRINGKDLCLDRASRYSQWFPPGRSMITEISREFVINRDSSDRSIEWLPGEYRAAFVFKDISVRHPANPEQKVHHDEWSSNEISFQIMNRSEQAAGADGPAQP